MREANSIPCKEKICANNDGNGACIALTDCLLPNCPFFKTRDQARRELKESRERNFALLREKVKGSSASP